MLCPHCGHDNADARKFCRNCAKPLTAEAATNSSAFPTSTAQTTSLPDMANPPVARAPVVHTPRANRMAVWSFVLSCFAIFLPFGIASVVMGHISRKQIANNSDTQNGMSVAFAGLVLSYIQMAAVVLIGLSIVSFWHRLNHELDRNPDTRAALLERIKYGDPSRPDKQVIAHRQKSIENALRLIVAKQEEYRASHADSYACSLDDLYNYVDDPELSNYIAQSAYKVDVFCRRGTTVGHVAQAVSRGTFNGPGAPIYCADQTGVIRRYGSDQANTLASVTALQDASCPDYGTPVE